MDGSEGELVAAIGPVGDIEGPLRCLVVIADAAFGVLIAWNVCIGVVVALVSNFAIDQ